jgi:antitoxin (DNA-binding transcriptional repressor) of toxin-antitoxin stability system
VAGITSGLAGHFREKAEQEYMSGMGEVMEATKARNVTGDYRKAINTARQRPVADIVPAVKATARGAYQTTMAKFGSANMPAHAAPPMRAVEAVVAQAKASQSMLKRGRESGISSHMASAAGIQGREHRSGAGMMKAIAENAEREGAEAYNNVMQIGAIVGKVASLALTIATSGGTAALMLGGAGLAKSTYDAFAGQ